YLFPQNTAHRNYFPERSLFQETSSISSLPGAQVLPSGSHSHQNHVLLPSQTDHGKIVLSSRYLLPQSIYFSVSLLSASRKFYPFPQFLAESFQVFQTDGSFLKQADEIM